MIVKVKMLLKGVSVKDGKDKSGAAKQYVNAELFAIDGRPVDLKAGFDGPGLIEKARKYVFQIVSATLEYTEWQGQGRWMIADIEPVKA